MQNSKILKNIGIIGYKGFIGTHLIKYLSAKNISYIVFEGDLLNKGDIEFFLKGNNISQVVFLVGTFNPSFENLIKINVLTLQNFLEVGIQHNLKKIIFTSTGAVYGEPIRQKSKETDPLKPNTLYGLSKLFAEECIKFYKNNYGLKYIILRFPNVYGDGNNKGVIHKFLSDIKKFKKIIIEGNGKQKRDFLYVEDTCRAIEKALTYPYSDIFNISNIKYLSINEVIDNLKTKYDFSIEYKPAANNLNTLSLDINKAKNILGFSPTIVKFKI